MTPAWRFGTAVAGTATLVPSRCSSHGHAFLNDIAHHAVPASSISTTDGIMNGPDILQVADSDTGDVNGDDVTDSADLTADDHSNLTYDDELLEAHKVTGDGRGNENIALTTVHHVFHSEHNRLADHTKDAVSRARDRRRMVTSRRAASSTS